MKGLLVKDMCLMLQRKQTLLLFLIINAVDGSIVFNDYGAR